MLASAVGLWPDLAAGHLDVNDNVSHFTMIERIVYAVEHGGNPLDAWSPEGTFGFPMLRDYQTLAHLLVAAVYFALGKTVALVTVFSWVRFLVLVLMPLSAFAAALLLELPLEAALCSGVLISLLSSGLYGLEFRSYVFAGYGLFPQSVATHLLLLVLGFGYRALIRGRFVTLTGLLLGLTFPAHLMFGYVGALSLCLLAVLPGSEAPVGVRIRRTLHVAAVALAVSAYQLAPLFLDSPIINHTRWDPSWRWDSYGASAVLKLLFTGEVMDAKRLPVLTLAALAGAIFVGMGWRKLNLGQRFCLAGAVLWILLFFGRPFWGDALVLIGVSPDMHLHRLVTAVQVFLLLLVSIAFGQLWKLVAARSGHVAAGALMLLALSPAIYERAGYLAKNAQYSSDNLAAYAAGKAEADAVVHRALERGGRVYPGAPSGWGAQNKIGATPLFAILSVHQVPAVTFLYNAMALTADVQTLNEANAAQYRLFGIRTVVAPAAGGIPRQPFWRHEQTIGRFDIFAAPDTGYFDVVDVMAAAHTTKHNFYDVNFPWMQSDAVEQRRHLWLDLGGPAPAGMPEWPAQFPAQASPPGNIASERDADQEFRAECDAARAAYVLFKMTWHSNWHAWVDGNPVATAMLSPGFIGVPVAQGRHTILLRYEGSAWKAWLALAGLLAALAHWAWWKRSHAAN